MYSICKCNCILYINSSPCFSIENKIENKHKFNVAVSYSGSILMTVSA